jgi:hypothetical protein
VLKSETDTRLTGVLLILCFRFSRIISLVLQTVKDQYLLLKGSGIIASDIVANFEEIQDLVRCRREVSWADHSGISIESGAFTPAPATPPPPSLNKSFEELLSFPVLQTVPLTPLLSTKKRSSPKRLKATSTHVRKTLLDANAQASAPDVSVSGSSQSNEGNQTFSLPMPTSPEHALPISTSPKHEMNVTFTNDDGVCPLLNTPDPGRRLSSTPCASQPSSAQGAENLPACMPIICTQTVIKEKPQIVDKPVADKVKRGMSFRKQFVFLFFFPFHLIRGFISFWKPAANPTRLPHLPHHNS